MKNRVELIVKLGEKETFDSAFDRLCQKMNEILLPINRVLDLLDIHRLTLEQKMLNKGLKHYTLRVQEGERSWVPRQRIFISPNDLLTFLFDQCSLSVELIEIKIVQFKERLSIKDISNRRFKNAKKALRIEKQTINRLDKELQKELVELFTDGKWLSSSQLQETMGRSRTSTILLGRVIDSVTFNLPGSERKLRRFILTHHIDTYYELQKLVFKFPIVME